jgi:hypothetical protein
MMLFPSCDGAAMGPFEVGVDDAARETSRKKRGALGGMPDAVGHHPSVAVVANEIPMITRLYYLWFRSVILAFRMLSLLPR